MNCELCFRTLRRTKAFSIYEEHFDNNCRLLDLIERYLQIKVCVCACKQEKSRTKGRGEIINKLLKFAFFTTSR